MRTIRLYGYLRQQFGREFTLDVRSPAEAVRALCAMLPGFRQAVLDYAGPGFHLRVGREYRGDEEVRDPCAEREIIKVIPATVGSGAAARIVVGALLIAASIWLIPTGMWATAALGLGASLVLGGVSELLAPKPKIDGGSASDRPRSYTFGNTLNTTGQGVAIPVGYGRLLVPSHVISAQVFSEEFPLNASSTTLAPADIAGSNTGNVAHVENTSGTTDYGNWNDRSWGGGD